MVLGYLLAVSAAIVVTQRSIGRPQAVIRTKIRLLALQDLQ